MKRLFRLAPLILGIVGFVVGTELKKGYEILSDRIASTDSRTFELALDPAAPHRVFLWAVDEERGYPWASVDATVRAVDGAGHELFAKRLGATESEEKGGVKRAQTGSEEDLPVGLEKLVLQVDLAAGDYLDLEVYRNLPLWLHLLPGISVLIGLGGLVLWLRARAAKT